MALLEPRSGDPDQLATAVQLNFSVLWGELMEICGPGDAILLTTQPVTGWRNPAREPARALWLVLEP